MPQPLSKVVPQGVQSLRTSSNTLASKPELAQLVCGIISASAIIDHELSQLLIRILGANAEPAIAMHDVLKANNVRTQAMIAAASAVLSEDDFELFKATLSAANTAQQDRHKLAHWIWGSCEELPDALLLADPAHLKRQTAERRRIMDATAAGTIPTVAMMESAFNIPADNILVYRKDDLEKALNTVSEGASAMISFSIYIQILPNPGKPVPVSSGAEILQGRLKTKSHALDQLRNLPLVAAALSRSEKNLDHPSKRKRRPSSKRARFPQE